MLENIVPLWLYLQLTIVLFSFLYIIVTEKNKILKQIKSNKSLYVLLSIIIIVGFGIRIINIVHSEYIVVDNSDYILKGTIISETGRFLHGYTNAPLFASIISLFIKTVNYNPSLGSILSVMFGTLSILLAFIFVRLFLKNNIVAILTAIILCFSNLHYDASVNGGPLGLSVFFIFLTLVLLEYIVITKKKKLCNLTWNYFRTICSDLLC